MVCDNGMIILREYKNLSPDRLISGDIFIYQNYSFLINVTENVYTANEISVSKSDNVRILSMLFSSTTSMYISVRAISSICSMSLEVSSEPVLSSNTIASLAIFTRSSSYVLQTLPFTVIG